MIHLSIIHSVDSDLLGDFKFTKNLIYIGKNEGDLRLDTPTMMNQHLFIEVFESKIIAQPNKKLNFFLTNGKRTTGPKFLKSGDEIDLGEIKFKLVDFNLTKFEPPREKLNAITDELIAKNDPIIEVIQIIQEE